MADIPSAVLATVSGLSLTAIATALVSFGEAKAFKENTNSKIDTNYKRLKEDLDAHEERDDQRHKELIGRIDKSEDRLVKAIERSK